MILKVFSVFDCKVEAFLQPFFMQTKGAAVRAFTEIVNDKTHNFGKYPADYTLFELGSFEDSSAKFELHKSPISVGIGIEFIKPVV